MGSTSTKAPNGCSRVIVPLTVAPTVSALTAWPHGSSMSALIDSAAPPRASPSILVSTAPSKPTCAANSRATVTASWPVMASTTRSFSSIGTALSIAALIRASSISRDFLRFSSSRPVVVSSKVSRSLMKVSRLLRKNICVSLTNWVVTFIDSVITSRLRFISSITSAASWPL